MSDGSVLVILKIKRIHDREALKRYQMAAREQIAILQGKVVARGGVTIEGEEEFEGLLIQEWRSEQDFRNWQSSEAYLPLKTLRQVAVDLSIVVVPKID
jgi:uncharacterized protein (DUF1330 family)